MKGSRAHTVAVQDSVLGGPPITKLEVAAYSVPTDEPESDGSLQWDHTTMVLVDVTAGGVRGLGYTYADTATATLIRDLLGPLVVGQDVFAIPKLFQRMMDGVRNLGHVGIAAMAMSAVDLALWDTKARLLQLPLSTLLGEVRSSVPIYGSGGFTSYTDQRLAEQLGGWAGEGFSFVKMKVGRNPAGDPARVRTARRAIGAQTQLFVDANGAYDRKQALAMAAIFAAYGVTWFEEPVSSDDLEGLHLIRGRSPAGMEIAAGEYGYDAFYFRRMLDSQSVDVLQADATRCGGVTGFLGAHALCDARSLPLSTHCAPALHLHLGCALPRIRHLEVFHDHQRLESMFFDGITPPRQGLLTPDRTRSGFGLELKSADVAQFRLT